MKTMRKQSSTTRKSKARQSMFENLEARHVLTGGLVTADPSFSQNPAFYSSFPNTELPVLHSNPSGGGVLYLYFEGGIQENGYYFYPSDYETKGTSTNTHSLSTGSKTFTVQAGLSFQPGHKVHIHDNAMSGPLFNGQATASLKYMNGTVTSYSGTTLVVNVTQVNGTGSISDWTVTNVHFNTEEREMIVDYWRQVARQFAIFNVDVTTDPVDLATKPSSIAGVRDTGNGGSIMSQFGPGKTLININTTDQPRYASVIAPHEFGHTLGLEHQANWNTAGLVAAEYGEAFNMFYFHMMGNRVDGNSTPHMAKWSFGQPSNSATLAQDDIAKIAASLTAAGVTPMRTTEPDFLADYGNNFGTAVTLTSLGNNTFGRTGIIKDRLDADVFAFAPTVDGYYDIMVGRDGTNADFYMHVQDGAGNLLANEDGDTTVATPTRNVYDQHVTRYFTAGTYYVSVYSHGNYADVGQYVVRASRVGDASGFRRAEDAGFVGLPGYSQFNSSTSTYTIAGSGADFGQDNNIMNGYQFLSQTLQGDGQIIARVSSIDGANEWSLGGIMIRSNLEGNDGQYVALVMTKEHGYVRYADNGAAARTAPIFESAGPKIGFTARYLRITRTGNSFAFAVSPNGTTWTTIGSSISMTMPSVVNIGMFSSGIGQANSFHSMAANALQNQRLTVTQFTNVSATATGSGVLNPNPFTINTFAPPTLTIGTVTNSGAGFTWNDVAGQTESGYLLERSEDGVNFTVVLDAGPTVFSHTDTSVHDYERYTYRIRAKKSDGTVSNPSVIANIYTKSNATDITKTHNSSLGTNSIVLHWEDVDGEDGYKVFRSTSQSGSYTQVGSTLGPNVTVLHDSSGKSANSTYWYRIDTVNPGGSITTGTPFSWNTRWTSTAVANLHTDGATSTSIDLDWNNFSSATSYRVYRGLPGAGSIYYTEVPVGSPTSSLFTDTGLAPNTTYFYRVFAVNSSGRLSAPSAQFAVTTGSSLLRAAAPSSSSPSFVSTAATGAAISNNNRSANLATPKASTSQTASKDFAAGRCSANLHRLALLDARNERRTDELSNTLLRSAVETRNESDRTIDELFADIKNSFDLL
jgi:hypothetical protein